MITCPVLETLLEISRKPLAEALQSRPFLCDDVPSFDAYQKVHYGIWQRISFISLFGNKLQEKRYLAH